MASSTFSRLLPVLLIAALVLALSSLPTANAFGAGNIASYSNMEGKAFRHGDIEDILESLLKKGGGGLFSLGSSKFGGLDIKRVYFGNWLRDYSQAVDTAGLSKLPLQTILNIVMVLGFLAHGYATGSFEVTKDRLGCYLPVEHIDNPKGYNDNKDARSVDPRLRGPVDQVELEVDPNTGMKNYIANESGHWDTSKAFVKRSLTQCIEMGRRARNGGSDADLHEAFRLLGQALHTMEDYPAHSNFCELALVKLGFHDVYTHVGDNVKVRAPDGSMVAPIVTGTFGGADFMHSLLGEAQDHLSSASVSDLQKKVGEAREASDRGEGGPRHIKLVSMMAQVPGADSEGTSRDAEELARGPPSDPNQMSPEEISRNLMRILIFRDRIMMSIETTIEKIPGLSSLVEKITNTLSVFVLTLIEPYVKPLISQALNGLHATSGAVVNTADQNEVFNNPNASDPTHSMLSKDHFGLILNELAGNVACVIVRHVVQLVVRAWDDQGVDPRQIVEECTAPLVHPFWIGQGSHPVCHEMLTLCQNWANSKRNEIGRLDRRNVQNHTNTRSGKAEFHHGENQSYLPGGPQPEQQQGVAEGTNLAHGFQQWAGDKLQSQGGVLAQASNLLREGPGGGGSRDADEGRSEYRGGNNNERRDNDNDGGYPGGNRRRNDEDQYRPNRDEQGGGGFFGGGGRNSGGYAPPSGPPPQQYAPPSGPPPDSFGGGYGGHRQEGSGHRREGSGGYGGGRREGSGGYGGQQGGYGGQQGGYGGGNDGGYGRY